MKKNIFLVLLLIGGLCIKLNAQETGASIRDQIVNNKVPGLKYAPAGTAVKKANPAKEDASVHSMRLKDRIQQGKLGMPVATGSGNTAAAKTAARPAGLVLPSEKAPAENKAELEKKAAEQKILMEKTQVPQQEEKAADKKAPDENKPVSKG